MQEAKIVNGWVVCPICGKKQFPINKDTIIKNLIFQCKISTSNSKHYFSVNTGGM